MKTALPTAINNIQEAQTFLTALYNNKEDYHPEDNATELNGNYFTFEEGTQLNKLMRDIYSLPGQSNANKMSFDPCKFLLELDPEYVEMADADLWQFLLSKDNRTVYAELMKLTNAEIIRLIKWMDKDAICTDEAYTFEYGQPATHKELRAIFWALWNAAKDDTLNHYEKLDTAI